MKIMNTPFFLYSMYGVCLLLIGIYQSPSLALSILALGLISAIMSLGINIQWGYAGLLNIGVMGFAAVGGATAVWVAAKPVPEAWQAGGFELLYVVLIIIATIISIILLNRYFPKKTAIRTIVKIAIILASYFIVRMLFTQAVVAIESVDPSISGFLGGLGAPIMISWVVGGMFAAFVAWLIGKVALGLRADYLGIATLGIAEILVSVFKNEDWLTRGVKNVVGLQRPVPDEVDLVQLEWLVSIAQGIGMPVDDLATIAVRLAYCALFGAVILLLLWLSETALRAPWGRMMHAIRDNEVAASAMGKDVSRLHLQVFVLGSAVVGLAGAMLVTLDGQFTPGSYQPLRFTFLIWIMVIIGGSGNNWGSILGGLVIWLFWVEAEPIGVMFMDIVTLQMAEDSAIKSHLTNNAAQMRLVLMGVLLLLVLRFAPGGLIPEKR